MLKLLLTLSALATAFLLNGGAALAADPEPASQMNERTDGAHRRWMSPQERTEHRARMHAAMSAAEREKIRGENDELVIRRAEGQGVTLPAQPPAQNAGDGPCSGKMACSEMPMSGRSSAANVAGIAYLSGGIGDDDPVTKMAEDYNLHMVFATQGSGEYVADVKVLIADAKGKKILEADSPGPIFYAKLPSGSYRITAEYQGKSLRKSVAVKDRRLRDLYFHWPSADEGSR